MKNAILLIVAAVAIGGGIYYAFGGASGGVEVYGQKLKAQAATVAQIKANPDLFAGKVVEIEGKMTKECPTSGCWWYVADASGEIRADSKGGGFALPLKLQGKSVRTFGKVVKTEGGDLQIAAVGAEIL